MLNIIIQLLFFVVFMELQAVCLLSMCPSKALRVPPGFFAISVSSVAAAAAVHQGVDLTYIHSHFLQLTTASFLISVLLSVYLYVRSHYAAAEQLALGGSSGKRTDPELPSH